MARTASRIRGSGLLALSVSLGACGGKVVAEPDGTGGGSTSSTGTTTSSSASSSTSTTTTAVSSTSTGTSPCSTHADCDGWICLFATGICAPPCDGFCESCGPGTICNGCASSSCPECLDCVAACVPVAPGQCDDDDPCSPDQVCIFSSQSCASACNGDDQCGDFEFCAECVTGSCCGCENCVSACVGGE